MRTRPDAGADILFIDALETEEEMRALCNLPGAAAKVPKVRCVACVTSSKAE